eukprot:gene7712-8519_t
MPSKMIAHLVVICTLILWSSVESFAPSLRRIVSKSPSLHTTTLYSTAPPVVDNPIDESIFNIDDFSEEANLKNHIFCNVELNLTNLEAVGFDMDFTLAQYNEDFDKLAFEGAKRKLVENLGYPPEILSFQYSADKFRRGLIIDKKRGNILKVDRHRYVRKVYHGLDELSTNIRKAIYRKQVASYTESQYANIDTIFNLVDAVLFTYLVDYRDRNPDLVPKSYDQLYSDVRQSVDLCHRDGAIKDAVMRNPEQYIIYDTGLVPMLQQLRNSGKRVFLLTNSLWEYTNVVMNYLVYGGKKQYNPDINSWKDLFDLIIVGACKPAFLKDDYLSIFKIDDSGSLHNVEFKESLTSLSLHDHKTFQGGCWQDLHRMLDVTFGDRILYVGDHMYADILRSKRTLGWRTCLIIPELDNELEVAKNEVALAKEVYRLRKLQFDFDDYIDRMRHRLHRLSLSTTSKSKVDSESEEKLVKQLQLAEERAEQLKKLVQKTNEEYNRRFNRYWGQLFKAGHQDSRFAKQVMDYACLYTSRATNLGTISPNRPFRPMQDFLPHDRLIIGQDQISIK